MSTVADARARSLELARSYLSDVEEQVGSLADLTAGGSEANGQGFLGGFRHGRAVAEQREGLLRDLDLALTEVGKADGAARSSGASAEAFAEISAVTAAAHFLKARVLAAAKDIDGAVRACEASIGTSKTPEAYYLLGLVRVEGREPRLACEAFIEATALEPTSDAGKEAAKAKGRLEAQKIKGKWFVGSRKVLFGLAGFTILSLLFVIGGGAEGLQFVPHAVIGGIGTVAYWKWKTR